MKSTSAEMAERTVRDLKDRKKRKDQIMRDYYIEARTRTNKYIYKKKRK